MSERPRSGKKDQQGVREVRDELTDTGVNEEPGAGRAEPKYRNPNRDRSRGDWNRTGRHTDEEG